MIDPNNPVVQLCQAGMQAEAQNRMDEARALFQRAWDARQNAFDACIAAHYLARHQDNLEDTLLWNQQALDQAAKVRDGSVQDFYPSLYLNLGFSYEMLGNRSEARACYLHAADRLQILLSGPYKEMVQGGIIEGLRRTAEPEE